ncbi:hypothetical protein [Sphingobium scionense]|jgi:chromate transport protein ChrA|uniref:Chromate transport protein ChrA n=1 Tax=Sphingobium scionense TaxID=1404341 RepID=A0A7W6PWE2_9SPHN|nr:hypothetical protein [Sphingobium scionense]MBB4148152.1 chromate transport protein ChrA [Sphingobium scionense]
MEMMWLSVVALLFAALVLLARSYVDFRRKEYLWAGICLAGALAILCAPIQSHAVKIDLPQTSER